MIIRVFENDAEGVTSVSLTETPSGFVSEWWISVYRTESPRVVACLSLPVTGRNEVAAWNAVDNMADRVSEAALQLWGGEGVVSGGSASEHARAQLEAYSERLLRNVDTVETVVAAYELLTEFRVYNPAILISEVLHLGSGVRYVQDKIADARTKGLIASFGRGRAHR